MSITKENNSIKTKKDKKENQYFKEVKMDYKRICATVATLAPLAIGAAKAMWYAYQSGRFSVYDIANVYMEQNSESILFQIVRLIAVIIVWFSINYLYYVIASTADDSKFHWKRKIRILFFWTIELICLFIVILLLTDTNIIDLFKEATIQNILSLLIALICIGFLINIYGIEFIIEKKMAERRKKKKRIKDGEYAIEEKEVYNIRNANMHRKRNILFMILVTAAIEIMAMYVIGVVSEYQRTEYKIIIENVEFENNSQYQFMYDCPTAHCGRCEKHFVVGAFTFPTVRFGR